MRMRTTDVLAFMRRHYSPFVHLSPEMMHKAEGAFRFFELHPGEAITAGAGRGRGYLYLIDGRITVNGGGSVIELDAVQTRRWPLPLPEHPQKVALHCDRGAVLCQADADDIDQLLSWAELAKGGDELGHGARMVRDALAFRCLPLEAAEEVFRRMTRIEVEQGAEMIRQGEPGDAFYIILSGNAEVWRQDLYDDEPQLVAELGAGDAFGEEALVVSGGRNATVKMASDGELLVLAKDDFSELVSAALLARVNAVAAKSLLKNGYKLLDVRYQEEFEESHVPGSVHVPLPDLRRRLHELDPKTPYLVMCRSGKRAAAATLLLRQRSFEAATVDGGVCDWPYEKASLMPAVPA